VISAGKRCSPVRPNPILGGLLAATSAWGEATFAANIAQCVAGHKGHERLDLVCCLEHGTLEYPKVSSPDESLIFLILRLLERLRAMETAPAVDWQQYGRSLR
jgi:hypothetical protein